MFKKKEVDKEGLNEIIFLSKNILKLLFIVLIIGIILFSIIILERLGAFSLLGNILKVLTPLFIGFAIAWLFSPLVSKLTKKGLPRVLASIIVYVVFIAFLFVFIKIFIPVLYEQINELIKVLPNILSKITDFINGIFDKININGVDIDSIQTNILNGIGAFGTNITSNLPTTIMDGITSVISGVGTLFFGLIIGLYMLFDFDNITNHFIKLMPRKHRDEVKALLENIGKEVRKSVNGTLLVACMVFVCDTIGFSLIGLKGALLFGLFCGITDLIPYIGPYLGTIVATIVGFTQSTFVGIVALVIAVVVQLVESYILQPIVMSKATNLHPVAIIVGLLIFGYLFGIVGMILAVPIMSIFKVIWHFFDDKYDFFKNNP